jgi:hypothetical protein
MADGIFQTPTHAQCSPFTFGDFSGYSERSDDRLNTTNLFDLFTVQNTCKKDLVKMYIKHVMLKS